MKDEDTTMMARLMNVISRILYHNMYAIEPGRFESFILGVRSNALLGPLRLRG